VSGRAGSFRAELPLSETGSFDRLIKWTDKRRGEPNVADEERSKEEQRRFDRMLDPFDGPASENAYPEDPVNDPDGSGKIMNDLSRTYNRIFGETDEAADVPWTPESAGEPKEWVDHRTPEERERDEARLAEHEDQLERFEESKLKLTSHLPDLEGDDLEITWDFEEGGDGKDDWTVLRHGDRVIWREVGLKAALPRFDEVIWILREKYGRRLVSLVPTREGLLQIRGRGYTAKTMVDSLNQELEDKRQPLEPKGSIEGDDADTDLPEPERQEQELMDSVRKMGMIDCSCGWIGDATEARIIGTGNARDVNCPECRRPLYRITIDD
jgi:hypothetical protein